MIGITTMRIRTLGLAIFWLALIATVSCARRGVPTGGPKDTIPPTLINMSPALETVNFDGDEIVLEFDEFIEARSLKQDIIINPRIEEYDFYVNRKSLYLELQEDLRENTTYTFNFRDAIKDVSEQNPAENVILAFSTGNTIDSFQVQGQIKDLLTYQPAEDVVVALYEEGDTLNPYEDAPLYLTKTNEEGRYAIRYIKTGTYQIYAYNDENNNLKIDSNSEALGFKSEPILLIPGEVTPLDPLDSTMAMNDSLQTVRYGEDVDIFLFRQDIRPIQVQSARSIGKYFDIKLNKSVREYELTVDSSDVELSTLAYLDSLNPELPKNSRRILYSNFQNQQKDLRIYQSILQDSLRVFVNFTDSVEQIQQDTFYVQFGETRRNPDELRQSVRTDKEIVDSIRMEIEFNKPMIRVNTDSILLSYDTLFYLPLKYDEFISWNESLDKVTLRKTINRNALADTIVNYQLARDSLNFYSRLQKQEEYLAKLQEPGEVEEKLSYFDSLTGILEAKELILIRDSLQTQEEDAQRLNLLNSVIDTLTLENEYQPLSIQKSEILENLKPLVLYLAPGSFMSIENDSSQQVLQRYSFKKADNYGNISGNISTTYESYTVQLLDKNYQVIRETGPSVEYAFELVPPGDYYLRVLIDEDLDGQWERGNILKDEEPEPVFFYTEEEVINLRANWFREIDLNF